MNEKFMKQILKYIGVASNYPLVNLYLLFLLSNRRGLLQRWKISTV